MATRIGIDGMTFEIRVPAMVDDIPLSELKPGCSYGALIENVTKDSPEERVVDELIAERRVTGLPPVHPVSFEEDLNERLKNPDYAVGYLGAAAEEGDEILLLAAKDVVRAHPFKALAIAILALFSFSISDAQAQSCMTITSGYFAVKRRAGKFCGTGFCVRVACTRWVPYEPYWPGGRICIGGRFYGRIGLYGPVYSCRILGFTRR